MDGGRVEGQEETRECKGGGKMVEEALCQTKLGRLQVSVAQAATVQ